MSKVDEIKNAGDFELIKAVVITVCVVIISVILFTIPVWWEMI